MTWKGPQAKLMGRERVEQPNDSDREAKLQRRKAKRRAGQCCARTASEHAIWQVEVRRKVVAGGAPTDAPSDMSIVGIIKKNFKNTGNIAQEGRLSSYIALKSAALVAWFFEFLIFAI